MTLPASLRAYRALTALLTPLAPGLLARRARAGKEDPLRIGERLGLARPDDVRPAGPLVWVHGVSVGESVLGLAIAARLRAARPDLVFLHTSGTVTSAGVIAGRLGPDDLHRYVPLDTPQAASSFVARWRPDLAMFVEGELWPNLLLACRTAGIPLALANARMTARSLRGWGRVAGAARALLGGFAAILPADRSTAAGLAALLGQDLPAAGNLKLAAPVALAGPQAAAPLQAALAGRPVWLAASTHEGEEQRLLSVHDTLRLAAPECLLILAPRHPERTADLEASCRMAGARVVRRSSGALPGPADTVWLWDTMGELTLAMALAPVTVMGGSLVEDVGGHNPVEPVAAGSAVISGTKVHNFADLFLDLEAAGGAVLCSDDHALTLALAGLLNDPGRCATMTGAARAVVAEGASAMDRAVAALLPLIRPSVDTKAPPERVP